MTPLAPCGCSVWRYWRHCSGSSFVLAQLTNTHIIDKMPVFGNAAQQHHVSTVAHLIVHKM
jgi:hypothetical protein